MLVIIIILSIAILIAYSIHEIRKPRIGRLHLISGGVKTGKTCHAVDIAIQKHKQAVKRWQKQQRRQPTDEKPPRLYSNMPLKNYRYYPLTLDIVTLKERVPNGSIIYVNEVSLFSGSMDIKNDEINDVLTKFYKLCAHLTKGYVILDTQNPMDMHYTAKRSLSTYWHIVATLKIPFVGLLSLMEARELVDHDVQTPSGDAQKRTMAKEAIEHILPKRIFIRFVSGRIWGKYDQYAYYSLVKDSPVCDESKAIYTEEGQTNTVVRLRDIIKRSSKS